MVYLPSSPENAVNYNTFSHYFLHALAIWQMSSTQMVGSFGYSAPEFALSGIYTVKSDVYSFGVVMLELLTGRKPLDRYVLTSSITTIC